jgi:hypothetical protein
MNFVRDLTLRYGQPLGYLDRSRAQWRHVSALPTYNNNKRSVVGHEDDVKSSGSRHSTNTLILRGFVRL